MHQALEMWDFFIQSYENKKKIDHTNVQTSNIKPTLEKCFTVKEHQSKNYDNCLC